MCNDIERIMFTKEDIQKAVDDLGKKITEDYKGKNLLVIAILKGSFVFMSDLIRAIDLECKLDFMGASSYSGKKLESSGVVTIEKDIELPIEGYDIIVVEDIVDSGNTLFHVKKLLDAKGANSIKICALFDKPCRRKVDISADYYGFTIGDEFIVGYGLDFDEKYRNLPYVGILKPEIYTM